MITNLRMELFEALDKAEHGAADTGGKVRLRSLDTLRGIAITLMIFVNDGGGGYWLVLQKVPSEGS